MFITFFLCVACVTGALLLGAAMLHLLPRLGSAGRTLAEAMTRAPLLDLLITYFTILPLILGPLFAGWIGLAGAIMGMFAALILWSLFHELVSPEIRSGPRIVSTINRKVGASRNLIAVYWTAVVVPAFWIVRVAELIVYPPLIWLVQFPAYRQGDWINVSRQKFQGLVGHDLIWCLYCDWMTGVWSLGSEMLRNVESFWCPIRYSSEKKCENCVVDFPDINQGWVPANGTMADVTRKLDEMYPAEQTPRTWFGHPVRLTIKGQELPEQSTPTAV